MVVDEKLIPEDISMTHFIEECAVHGKKLPGIELIYLIPHEVQGRGVYLLDLSDMPFFLGVTFVSIIVFVIPEYKSGDVWPVL